MFREKEHRATNGLLVLLVAVVMMIVSVIGIIGAANAEQGAVAAAWAVLLVATIIACAGLFTVNPNEGRVLTLFGKYVGTVR